jgi:hypothetical protein
MPSLCKQNRRLREPRAEATARSKAVEEASVDGILTIGESRTVESASRLAWFEEMVGACRAIGPQAPQLRSVDPVRRRNLDAWQGQPII